MTSPTLDASTEHPRWTRPLPWAPYDLCARYIAVASFRVFFSLDLLSSSLDVLAFPGMSFFKLDMVEELRIDASSADILCFSSKVEYLLLLFDIVEDVIESRCLR